MEANENFSVHMNKLTIKQKNWLLFFHIAFATLWTGTVLSMALIAFHNKNTSNGEELHALNSIIDLLDNFVVIPSAIGSLLTGALFSWLTTWGFVKFYWVIAKWIGTVSLIMFGTFWLYLWANTATSISANEGLKAFENQFYRFDASGVIIGSIVQVSCLLFLVAISTLKPWGKRKLIKASTASE